MNTGSIEGMKGGIDSTLMVGDERGVPIEYEGVAIAPKNSSTAPGVIFSNDPTSISDVTPRQGYGSLSLRNSTCTRGSGDFSTINGAPTRIVMVPQQRKIAKVADLEQTSKSGSSFPLDPILDAGWNHAYFNHDDLLESRNRLLQAIKNQVSEGEQDRSQYNFPVQYLFIHWEKANQVLLHSITQQSAQTFFSRFSSSLGRAFDLRNKLRKNEAIIHRYLEEGAISNMPTEVLQKNLHTTISIIQVAILDHLLIQELLSEIASNDTGAHVKFSDQERATRKAFLSMNRSSQQKILLIKTHVDQGFEALLNKSEQSYLSYFKRIKALLNCVAEGTDLSLTLLGIDPHISDHALSYIHALANDSLLESECLRMIPSGAITRSAPKQEVLTAQKESNLPNQLRLAMQPEFHNYRLSLDPLLAKMDQSITPTLYQKALDDQHHLVKKAFNEVIHALFATIRFNSAIPQLAEALSDMLQGMPQAEALRMRLSQQKDAFSPIHYLLSGKKLQEDMLLRNQALALIEALVMAQNGEANSEAFSMPLNLFRAYKKALFVLMMGSEVDRRYLSLHQKAEDNTLHAINALYSSSDAREKGQQRLSESWQMMAMTHQQLAMHISRQAYRAAQPLHNRFHQCASAADAAKAEMYLQQALSLGKESLKKNEPNEPNTLLMKGYLALLKEGGYRWNQSSTYEEPVTSFFGWQQTTTQFFPRRVIAQEELISIVDKIERQLEQPLGTPSGQETPREQGGAFLKQTLDQLKQAVELIHDGPQISWQSRHNTSEWQQEAIRTNQPLLMFQRALSWEEIGAVRKIAKLLQETLALLGAKVEHNDSSEGMLLPDEKKGIDPPLGVQDQFFLKKLGALWGSGH